jgi:hypothetical protein
MGQRGAIHNDEYDPQGRDTEYCIHKFEGYKVLYIIILIYMTLHKFLGADVQKLLENASLESKTTSSRLIHAKEYDDADV